MLLLLRLANGLSVIEVPSPLLLCYYFFLPCHTLTLVWPIQIYQYPYVTHHDEQTSGLGRLAWLELKANDTLLVSCVSESIHLIRRLENIV